MRHLRAFVVSLLLALLFAIAPRCLAGLGPENVAVVVNEDSWASKAVANEFIALYHVPPANVIYITGLPDFERTDVEFFRKQVLLPVLKTLEHRGLAAQIDCIAWSADIPYIVDITKDFAAKPHITVGSAGSITGLTYLYAYVFADSKHAPPGSYTLPNSNHYFRPVLPPRKGPAPTASQQSRLAEAVRLIHSGRWTDAEATVQPLLEECPDYAEALVVMALCSAHRGELDEAVKSLQRAADCGWSNGRAWEHNKIFEPLRNRKDFQAAVEKCKTVFDDVAPSQGFGGSCSWDASGERAALDKGGVRYMLSVMLAVTSGRGNSVPEALGALRAAAGSNGTCPKGTFYFMRNEDIRSTVRDGLFPSVISKLRAMGLAAEEEEGIVPRGKPDVLGAVIGAADFDWKGSGSRILPGAICENFTSFGGILTEGAGQTPLTSLIAFGAAGSSGTVTEPIAIPEKFPSPFIHVHYARGCSLAEAYYQSVATPYQLLIVGDPLCAPWRRPPAVVLSGLTAGQTITGPFALKPSVAADSPAAQKFEIYLDGFRRGSISPGKDAMGNAKEMLDGYHEMRIVAVSGGEIEERDTTILPITVDKSGRQLAISGPGQSDAPWDRPLRLSAELKGAAEIRFLHNSRLIGAIHGEKGEVEIEPQLLGQGPCRIQCLALDAGRKPMAVSAFIEVRVVPPAPAPAVAPPEGALSEKGLLLRTAGAAPIVVAETRKKDWLTAAGVKEGQAFALEGYFEAPEDGVYQFQVRGNVGAIIEVDGRGMEKPNTDAPSKTDDDAPPIKVKAADSAAWAFLPVSLAKGLHKLRVTGEADKDPILDVRFGGRGAQSIGGAFKHVKPAAPPATSGPSAQPSSGK